VGERVKRIHPRNLPTQQETLPGEKPVGKSLTYPTRPDLRGRIGGTNKGKEGLIPCSYRRKDKLVARTASGPQEKVQEEGESLHPYLGKQATDGARGGDTKKPGQGNLGKFGLNSLSKRRFQRVVGEYKGVG